MTRVEESIDIKRPAEAVFAFTTEAKSWRKWQSIIPSAEQTSSSPVGVGSTFKGTSRMMGLSMKWTAKATEYEPSKKFGKNITSPAMHIEQLDTYTPADGGTKFTLRYDIKVRGVFNLFSPMMMSTMHKELKKSLRNLKGVLEAQG